jgi:hypothetical protein
VALVVMACAAPGPIEGAKPWHTNKTPSNLKPFVLQDVAIHWAPTLCGTGPLTLTRCTRRQLQEKKYRQ